MLTEQELKDLYAKTRTSDEPLNLIIKKPYNAQSGYGGRGTLYQIFGWVHAGPSRSGQAQLYLFCSPGRDLDVVCSLVYGGHEGTQSYAVTQSKMKTAMNNLETHIRRGEAEIQDTFIDQYLTLVEAICMYSIYLIAYNLIALYIAGFRHS
jgi:hypothetical protein